jgi:hypothetical protein
MQSNSISSIRVKINHRVSYPLIRLIAWATNFKVKEGRALVADTTGVLLTPRTDEWHALRCSLNRWLSWRAGADTVICRGYVGPRIGH